MIWYAVSRRIARRCFAAFAGIEHEAILQLFDLRVQFLDLRLKSRDESFDQRDHRARALIVNAFDLFAT
jgi:hypothetical protein